MIEQQIMPAFVFAPYDIELEAGFILAGMLIVDLPREVEELTEDEQQMVAAIIRQLTDAAQSGRMAADALVDGRLYLDSDIMQQLNLPDGPSGKAGR